MHTVVDKGLKGYNTSRCWHLLWWNGGSMDIFIILFLLSWIKIFSYKYYALILRWKAVLNFKNICSKCTNKLEPRDRPRFESWVKSSFFKKHLIRDNSNELIIYMLIFPLDIGVLKNIARLHLCSAFHKTLHIIGTQEVCVSGGQYTPPQLWQWCLTLWSQSKLPLESLRRWWCFQHFQNWSWNVHKWTRLSSGFLFLWNANSVTGS